MVLIVAVLALVVLTFSQKNVFSCFYIQRFSFFSDTSIHSSGSSSITLTWASTQSNIINSSYVLTGWSIPTSNVRLSYEAGLSSVTSTGSQFTLNISSGTQLASINFQIILAKSCKGRIQLQLIDYTPTDLSQSNRSPNTQTFSVYVSPAFGSSANNYIYDAIISSFKLTSTSDNILQLKCSANAPSSGQNYQTINLYSLHNHDNIYSKISLTYIMIEVSSFNYTLSYFITTYSSSNTTSTSNNIGIPNNFNPYLSQKCIIGVKWIQTNSLSTYSMTLNDTGNSTYSNYSSITISNLQSLSLSRFCLQECPYSYVNYAASNYICNACSSLANCSTCTSASQCTSCTSGSFLNGTNCSVCPSGYFADTTSSSCELCSIAITNCTACQSSTNCTAFNTSNYLLNYACSQTCPSGYVDITMSYTCDPCQSLVAFCETCSYPPLRCLSCISGYYLLVLTNQCYLTCPTGYYGMSPSTICLTCMSGCLTCTSSTTCSPCNEGLVVSGLCTSEFGCSQVTINSSSGAFECISCYSNLFIQFSNGLCVCLAGYKLAGKYCTNVVGCTVAVAQSNTTVCKFCNPTYGLSLQNGLCQCKSGFYLGSNACLQICGDGMLFTLQCDDGNSNNGDGCSSACKIQSKYECINGSSSSPSFCFRTKQNLTVSLSRIEKAELSNQGIFTFQLSPSLISDYIFNLDNVLFTCNSSSSISKITNNRNYLTVYVDYTEDLEGREANLLLLLDVKYLNQSSVALNFTMISNGFKLIIIKNAAELNICKIIFQVFSIIILMIFFLSLFAHKMIGVELIHCFQVIYLVHLINPSYTLPYSLIKYFAPITFNFLYFQNDWTNISSVYNNATFSNENQKFTLEFIFGISFVLLGVFTLLKRSAQANKSQLLRNQQLGLVSSTSVAKLDSIAYNNFLFPFAMGTFMISVLAMGTKNILSNSPRWINASCCMQMVVLGLIFFYEHKAIFLSSRRKESMMGVPRCRGFYIPIYLTLMMLVEVILNVAHLSLEFSAEAKLAGVYTIFLFFMIGYRPYESILHNIGVIVNFTTVTLFLIWSALKSEDLILQTEQVEVLALFALFILVGLAIFLTSFRIIYQFRLKCSSLENPKSINQSQQKKQSKSGNQNCEVLLQKQSEFMSKLQRENMIRFNEVELLLFLPHPQHKEYANKQKERDLLKKNLRAQRKQTTVSKKYSGC